MDLTESYSLGKYDGISAAESILAVAISRAYELNRSIQIADVRKIFSDECARYRADINKPITEEDKRKLLES